MSQKEIQESLDLMEKDWDFDPILHDFVLGKYTDCLLYTSPSPRDLSTSRMPSSA